MKKAGGQPPSLCFLAENTDYPLSISTKTKA
jgi:hypothetical protein